MKLLITVFLIFIQLLLSGQTFKEFALPEPNKTGGMPIMEALNNRHSTRSFTEQKLSKEQMSNLLWAGFGVNRPLKDKRTAPSARNFKEIDIYVCIKEGVFIYKPTTNSLMQISDEDIREITGTQNYVKDAAVNLVYIADYSRLANPEAKERQIWAYANAGFISQNIYLYCASEGLGTIVRALVPREVLAKKLNLKFNQEIILAQTVGYEK